MTQPRKFWADRAPDFSRGEASAWTATVSPSAVGPPEGLDGSLAGRLPALAPQPVSSITTKQHHSHTRFDMTASSALSNEPGGAALHGDLNACVR